MMTHPILYSRFRQYTIKKFPHYVVYINLYQLIEVYRNKVINLHMMARALKKRMEERGAQFDPRNANDPQYQALQIMVGRSMMNMLEYINQHYESHFKYLAVDELRPADLGLNEDQRYGHDSGVRAGSQGCCNLLGLTLVQSSRMSMEKARSVHISKAGISPLRR